MPYRPKCRIWFSAMDHCAKPVTIAQNDIKFLRICHILERDSEERKCKKGKVLKKDLVHRSGR
jgi:hypothetical protein